ncbi:hypothetical protein [Paenibacillus polymyxa]|uniref:hypothetical protein n=1 Tax=Paenibacillus polymyxa TaxID=1406 RepID=UPI001118CEEA|nr:hypothetical protein [Paenibacillus polymyxa]QDA26745.1 hypothetical protein FGY93_07190 [Paenibacillus polymyxa]UQQ35574.1 hypothetical protein LMH85_01000 [Paenibacillus polymyxa]
MNPAIKRNRKSQGNNIVKIITKADVLYDDFNVDLLDDNTLLDALNKDRKAANIVKHVLSTNDVLTHLYPNSLKYQEVLKILKEAAYDISCLLKKLKREHTNKNKEVSEEYQTEILENLMVLSKKYLIRYIIKYASQKQIKKLERVAERKRERIK